MTPLPQALQVWRFPDGDEDTILAVVGGIPVWASGRSTMEWPPAGADLVAGRDSPWAAPGPEPAESPPPNPRQSRAASDIDAGERVTVEAGRLRADSDGAWVLLEAVKAGDLVMPEALARP